MWGIRIRGLATLAVAARCVEAQSPPLRELSKPDAEFSQPFSIMASIRQLRDGRVLVADRSDKTVQLIDFVRQTATPVGRTGQGPGEFGIPYRLFGLRGDTTLLADLQNLRYLVISPSGKAGDVFALDDTPDRRVVGVADAVDRTGRLYFFVDDRYGARDASGLSAAQDKIVVRRDRVSRRVDTVTTLATPPGRRNATRSLPGGKVFDYTNRPLAPEDAVAFAADGRIAVVRAADYHVEWIGVNGNIVKGPPVPYDAPHVTQADKDAFVAHQTRAGQIIVFVQGGATPPPTSGSGARTPPPGAMPAPRGLMDAADVVWPARMPAFLGSAAKVADDGRLWVLRVGAASDNTPDYDVFDERGQRVERVALPKGTRLMGFGAGAVYLVRTDADDLQYLQRYQVR